MSLHNNIETQILDHLFGNQAYAPPGTFYLAVSLADPTDDGSGLSEPGDASYARIPITNNATEFPAATSPGGVGSKTNGNDQSYSAAATGFGLLTHWALMDAVSGGNVFVYGVLNPNVTINASDVLTIKAGAMLITCD